MVLTVHHLGHSRSERVVWLCEELGLDYELKKYDRSPLLSPPQYLALHPIGAAPIVTDGDIVIAESGACVEYIINIYGKGKLSIPPSAGQQYADYLYWMHSAEGTMMAATSRSMSLKMAGLTEESNIVHRYNNKLNQIFEFTDRVLGEHEWLVGDEFTAADVMVVFTFTTMRQFFPMDFGKYKNILAYLQRVAKREAYQKAMQKGDPDIDVQSQLGAESPPLFSALRR